MNGSVVVYNGTDLTRSCATTPAIALVFAGMFIGLVVDVALTLTEKVANVLTTFRRETRNGSR